MLCYRDEYVEILADKRGDFDVLTVHEWLLPSLGGFEARSASEEMWYLFALTVLRKPKCQTLKKSGGAIFKHFGAALTSVPVGAVGGMAGTFGHEVDKLQMSKDIYGLSWKPRMQDLPKERCLVTGYSCRSQVRSVLRVRSLPIHYRRSQNSLIHLAQQLLGFFLN